MRETNRLRPHTTTGSRPDRRAPHTEARPGRRPSTQLISDAVIAGYIHDISQRHSGAAPMSEGHRRRG